MTYGKAMPITVLANETYATEMDRLLKYEGFGGDKLVILKDDERQRDPNEPIEDDRFVNAATLINRSTDSPLPPPRVWDGVFTSNGATLEGALERISGYPETTEAAVTPD